MEAISRERMEEIPASADDPDFGDLEALTAQIEAGTMRFIRDVEGFLARYMLF